MDESPDPTPLPEETEAALQTLYGRIPPEPAGVVHVAAVWQAPDGRQYALRVGDGAPTCALDAFALAAARARADAIVTTGRILRMEPACVHDLRGPHEAGLRAYRQGLGKPRAPYLLVISSGVELPLEHPALRAQATPILYTTRSAHNRLSSEIRRHPTLADLRIVSERRPTLIGALDYLRVHLRCRNILVEAGPSTAAKLYQPPVQVEELLLTVLVSEHLPDAARGPEFVDRETVRSLLPQRSSIHEYADETGLWQFSRAVRTSG